MTTTSDVVGDAPKATPPIADAGATHRLSFFILIEPLVTSTLILAGGAAALRYRDIYIRQFEHAVLAAFGQRGLDLYVGNQRLIISVLGAAVIVSCLFAIYRLLSRFVIWRSSVLTISPKQVLWRTGFIQRSMNSVALQDVIGVRLDQSILGRLFRYGSLIVETRGTGALRAWPLHDVNEARLRIESLKAEIG